MEVSANCVHTLWLDARLALTTIHVQNVAQISMQLMEVSANYALPL